MRFSGSSEGHFSLRIARVNSESNILSHSSTRLHARERSPLLGDREGPRVDRDPSVALHQRLICDLIGYAINSRARGANRGERIGLQPHGVQSLCVNEKQQVLILFEVQPIIEHRHPLSRRFEPALWSSGGEQHSAQNPERARPHRTQITSLDRLTRRALGLREIASLNGDQREGSVHAGDETGVALVAKELEHAPKERFGLLKSAASEQGEPQVVSPHHARFGESKRIG